MIQVGKAIVTSDLIEQHFNCDLNKCKGICCVEGVSGAPLEDDEADLLKNIFPVFKKYLSTKSLKAIEEQGLWYIDSDGDKVTPLVDKKECAFVVFQGDIANCAIEKAFFDGLIKFRKPISCHIYPVRLKKYPTYEAVNYHRWEGCKPAVKLGLEKDMYAFAFLRESLERKFGKKWYKELSLVAKQYNKVKIEKKKS